MAGKYSSVIWAGSAGGGSPPISASQLRRDVSRAGSASALGWRDWWSRRGGRPRNHLGLGSSERRAWVTCGHGHYNLCRDSSEVPPGFVASINRGRTRRLTRVRSALARPHALPTLRGTLPPGLPSSGRRAGGLEDSRERKPARRRTHDYEPVFVEMVPKRYTFGTGTPVKRLDLA
jgi:hypothetical protein